MPRDTPPPVPRRPYRGRQNQFDNHEGPRQPHALPAKPQAPAQTTYSAAPQVRDLRKEATAKFMPSVVASKMRQIRTGVNTSGEDGRLLEPEEVAALEAAGYAKQKQSKVDVSSSTPRAGSNITGIEDEEARFARELAELEQQGEQEEDPVTAQRHQLRDASRLDVQQVVDAAEEEAEYRMMADEQGVGYAEDDDAEKELQGVEKEDGLASALGASTEITQKEGRPRPRLVEIEDVDDDEW